MKIHQISHIHKPGSTLRPPKQLLSALDVFLSQKRLVFELWKRPSIMMNKASYLRILIYDPTEAINNQEYE